MLDNAHEITVKLFAKGAVGDVSRFVPVFHRWIQQSTVQEMTIDVADYSHMWQGPGVLLVCHEANYAIDLGSGRPGLLYRRKARVSNRLAATKTAAERLHQALLQAFKAAATLQKEEGVEFDTREILLGIDNRLWAPNTEETFQSAVSAWKPVVQGVLGQSVQFERISIDPRQPLRVLARLAEEAAAGSIAELAAGEA